MNTKIHMTEENIDQEFKLKEINGKKLISKKHKKVYKILNYTEHLLILASTIAGCVWISGFASLVGIPVGIASSSMRIKICVLTATIKQYKSIIREKKEKYDKIVLLAKTKLNNIEVLVSKALIDWNVNQDEFVLMDYLLKQYD